MSTLAYANAQPPQLARVIPSELRNFPKFEVAFFQDKIPRVVGSPTTCKQFLKLLQLYTTGVLTKSEFMTLVNDLMPLDSQ